MQKNFLGKLFCSYNHLLFLSTVLLLVAQSVDARSGGRYQNKKYTISGKIKDAASGEDLIGAYVVVKSGRPESIPFNNGDNVFVYDKWVFGGKERGFEIEYPLVTYGAIAPVKTELTVLPGVGKNDGRTVFYFFPGIDSEGLVPTTAKELKFVYGDTIQQRKMAISDPYYLFLRAVLLETKYYGGVLSSVPANVQTNVSNGAVGFFSASSSISRKSLIK